jgi:lactoylglutathione lyase
MFSHVFIGVADFERALAFYTPLMVALGLEARFCDRSRPWAGWQVPGQARPLFLIGAPYDGRPHAAGNGQMTALLAPGLRPDYHAHYYGAYVRDPDGNKLCVVCHDAPSDNPT